MDKPNFYSIIPANVRYDKDLTPNAKLLYGEISALANIGGKCCASNEYFSKLYNLSDRTISRMITQLKNKEYININYVYKDDTKEVIKRNIFIVTNNDIEVVSKMSPRGVKNVGDNNKKKYNNSKELLLKKKSNKSIFIPPSLQDILNYKQERQLEFIDCEYFYNYFNDNNWVDSKGREVNSWKQKMLTWNKLEKKKKEQKEVKYDEFEYPRY